MADKFIVNVMGLNLREQPTSSSRMNILAVLDKGIQATHVPSDLDNNTWIRIKVEVTGQEVIGYVAKRFLDEDTGQNDVVSFTGLKAVHMEEGRTSITRNRENGRAYPIGETDRPSRDLTSEETKKTSIHNIIKYLDVEESLRYRPGRGKTFCNIYVYDVCYLSGAYFPRVWWKEEPICKLARGKKVIPIYNETLREMNVNMIHDWLETFGERFGWKRMFDVTKLQEEANKGKVCIITAQRLDLNRSGHVVMVVSETVEQKCEKREDGTVKFPLQSQAGATNRKYFTDVSGSKWWTASKFRDFGFWVWE